MLLLVKVNSHQVVARDKLLFKSEIVICIIGIAQHMVQPNSPQALCSYLKTFCKREFEPRLGQRDRSCT